jgi:hypothetical protein
VHELSIILPNLAPRRDEVLDEWLRLRGQRHARVSFNASDHFAFGYTESEKGTRASAMHSRIVPHEEEKWNKIAQHRKPKRENVSWRHI